MNEIHPAWFGRSIAGPRLRLVEFSAFLEQQLQPDTDSVGFNASILSAACSQHVSVDMLHCRGGNETVFTLLM